MLTKQQAELWDKVVPYIPENDTDLTTWIDFAKQSSPRPSIIIGGIERAILRAGYTLQWDSPDSDDKDWEIGVYKPGGWVEGAGVICDPSKLTAAIAAMDYVVAEVMKERAAEARKRVEADLAKKMAEPQPDKSKLDEAIEIAKHTADNIHRLCKPTIRCELNKIVDLLRKNRSEVDE